MILTPEQAGTLNTDLEKPLLSMDIKIFIILVMIKCDKVSGVKR
jgi:hypothetical protein